MNNYMISTQFLIHIKYISIQGKLNKIISIVKFISLRYVVRLGNGYFVSIIISPSGWTHIIANYIGPHDGQGIQIYMDGIQRGSDTSSSSISTPEDRYIIIGRYYHDRDEQYASVQLDELIVFNATLTDSEITMLSQF